MKKLLQLIRFLFVKQNIMEAYYIQGSDVLPKPLGKEGELVALIAPGSGDGEARNTLIGHNFRLVICITRRYGTNPIFMEDLIGIGSIGLVKAVSTFKRGRNIKLVTYTSCCIENGILILLRRKSRRKVEVSFDKPLNIDYDGDELLLSDILGTDDDVMTEEFGEKENKRGLLEAMSTLKKRKRQILQVRYGIQHEELTQKGIAKRLSISRSYISRSEGRIIVKLKVQMKNSQ